jgi:hypothetical protein
VDTRSDHLPREISPRARFLIIGTYKETTNLLEPAHQSLCQRPVRGVGQQKPKGKHMKRTIVLATLGALLAVGTAWTSQAQTNVITQTNVTLDLDFYLSTVAQGTVSTNHDTIVDGVVFGSINEASIISELGASTSNNFSRHAELWLVIPIAAPDDWSVKVRDGTNSPVDVTGFFTYAPGTNSVGKTTVSTTTGAMGDTEYSIDRFGLHDQTGFPALSTHFHVSGFTITTTRGILPTATSDVIGEVESINACVDGTGEQDGNLIIIEGIVTARNNEGFRHPIPVFAGGRD